MTGRAPIPDVIVVGSGASAVHGAWPLVMAGARVMMLDVGVHDEQYARLIPDASFSTLRRTDKNQHRYLLGDRFEGVPFGEVRVGAQLTPPRGFVTREADRLTPVDGVGFLGMESLATGGLAAAWGASAARFSDADLAGVPLTASELAEHYAAVERRIGVCGEDDDLTQDLGLPDEMLPALPPDSPSRRLLASYEARREARNRHGLRLGVARLAVCSRQHEGRGPHPLDDLDFWSDRARAVYRPRWTLETLIRQDNFTYVPGYLVERFSETSDRVVVSCRRLGGGEEDFAARSVVLAAGTFGTARIVLRSLGLYGRAVPYVCNPYTYAPCLQPSMVGMPLADARHSLAQLAGTFTPPGTGWPAMHLSVYSYRSLLTFKLLKETPLSVRVGTRLMPALIPLLIIFGLHHADEPAPGKSVTLLARSEGSEEHLLIAHRELPDVSRRMDAQERLLLREMRRLGCFALKRVYPGPGSSIRYAGTFPMSQTPTELETWPDGRLSGTERVYLADGSLLARLPAKGLTLTLMANANRIGTGLGARL